YPALTAAPEIPAGSACLQSGFLLTGAGGHEPDRDRPPPLKSGSWYHCDGVLLRPPVVTIPAAIPARLYRHPYPKCTGSGCPEFPLPAPARRPSAGQWATPAATLSGRFPVRTGAAPVARSDTELNHGCRQPCGQNHRCAV